MNLNWRLVLCIAVIAIGIWYYVKHRESPTDPQNLAPEYRQALQRRRWIGIALVILGLAGCGYLYYTNNIALTLRANMPSDCDICQVYMDRQSNLRPYHTKELKLLQGHAKACNDCSQTCYNLTKVMANDPNVSKSEQKRFKDACFNTTKHAMLARKELRDLDKMVRDRGVKHLRTAQAIPGNKPRGIDYLFPKVPSGELKF